MKKIIIALSCIVISSASMARDVNHNNYNNNYNSGYRDGKADGKQQVINIVFLAITAVVFIASIVSVSESKNNSNSYNKGEQ